METDLPMVGFIDPKDVKLTGLNPPERTTPRRLSMLKADIAEDDDGVILPIVITRDGYVVDGHCRLQCAKELGLKEIPYRRVSKTWEEARSLYIRLIETQQRWTTYGWLARRLLGGDVGKSNEADFDAIERVGGQQLLIDIHKSGQGTRALRIARTVARYCDIDPKDTTNDPHLSRIIRWLIEGRRQRQVEDAMKHNLNPNRIWIAVEKNRDIQWPK